MNNLIDNIVIFLSHPFVILLLLVVIGYCIWYRKSGQEQRDKDAAYNQKIRELKEEQDKINIERDLLEQDKSDFEEHKRSIIYIKDSHSDKTLLLVLLIISIILNVYLLHELQEYYRIFGELKEMSEILKMFL